VKTNVKPKVPNKTMISVMIKLLSAYHHRKTQKGNSMMEELEYGLEMPDLERSKDDDSQT